MEHKEASNVNRLYAQGVGLESFPSICATTLIILFFFACAQLKPAGLFLCADSIN